MLNRQSSNSLSIIHINAQSLFCHIDEFRADLASCSVDIALVSETWLKSFHTDLMVSVFGYRCCRNDRPDIKRAGGVAIFYKNNLKCTVLSKSSFSNYCCEYLFCEISNRHSKILVGCVYKPPNCSSLDIFYEQLRCFGEKYVKILIGGDFNLDLLNHSQAIYEYKSHLNTLGLFFVNSSHPTHLQSTPSLLDHMLVSDSSLVHMYQQLSAPAYSKHDMLFIVLDFPVQPTVEETYIYRNFKAINLDEISEDIQSINWSLTVHLSLESCVEFIEQELIKLFDHHVPLVTRKITSKDNPWMTSELRTLRAQRNLAYSTWKKHRLEENNLRLRQDFNLKRNLVTLRIRQAKVNFLSKRLDPKQSTSVLWKNLRSIGIGDKSKDSCELNPNSLINCFFPPEALQLSLPTFSRRNVSSFNFQPVSSDDVIFAIHSMKSNAIGLDEVSLKFVKIILPGILNVITYLFNRCLAENYFPTLWKRAKVIPVPKKGGKEFRPISILPCLSKVLEKLMYSQIINHLRINKLHNKFQSGFREFHSCESAILEVSEVIRNAMDKNEAVILVLIDFSKAFDTIIHNLLVDKLKLRFGFSEHSCALVGSYLNARTSFIASNKSLSQPVANKRGVPQGSILGPMLFSLYIDDMVDIFVRATPHFYADDTQIFLRCKIEELPQAVDLINRDLEYVSKWSSSNGLQINAAKTQCIVFTRRRYDTSLLPHVTVNGIPVHFVDAVNNLGIIMTPQLNWDSQITKCTRSIYFGLRSLWCHAAVLPQPTKLKLAQSLLCPHLTAGAVVVGNMSYYNLSSLQRAFNSIIRFVYGLRKYDHISHLSSSIVGLPLDHFLVFRRLLFLFKLVKFQQPEYLYNRLNFSHSTRTCNINVPAHQYDIAAKSFFICDIINWNDLHVSIKRSTSVNMFKSNLKNMLSSL